MTETKIGNGEKVAENEKKDKRKASIANKRRSEIIFLICLFAFPVVHKLIFYVGGNINSFALAFERYDTGAQKFVFTGFDNFKLVLSDLAKSATLRSGIWNTLIIYLLDTFVRIPIALLCSYFVVKKVPASGLLKIVFFLPNLVSSVVMTLMFKYFCEYAIPDVMSELFGIKDFPLILMQYPHAFPMMLVYNFWTGFAGGIVLYVGTMSKVPDGVVEAAQIDGIGIMGEFWHITMPTVYPLLSVFLITGLTGMFIGGGPIFNFYQYDAPIYCYTTGYFLFTKVMGDNASYLTYPYPAAVGMLVTVIAAPLTFLLKYLLERFGPSED